jgi:E3 ubiquitin-protein ligase RNF13
VLNLIAIETLDPAQETTACRPIPGVSIRGSWAALVERGGDCSFVDKVRNMQASGARAVVVGDNKRSGLITMYARGNEKKVSKFAKYTALCSFLGTQKTERNSFVP